MKQPPIPPTEMAVDEITSVMIVGTGRMGAQIGVDLAMAGLDVVCMVRSPEVGQRRLTEASDLLKSFTSVEKSSLDEAMARILVDVGRTKLAAAYRRAAVKIRISPV